MSNSYIVNAAPMVISLGISDKSTRVLPLEPEAIPTHLPKIYLYAAKGKAAPQLCVGNMRNTLYGDDTFQLDSKFATHATVIANIVNQQGNAQMIERVLPADIGPKANFLLSVDVLQTTNTVYQRDNDGFIILDNAGLPLPATPAATVPGLKLKWVLSHVTAKQPGDVDSDLFGQATSAVGELTDEDDNTSMRYPILQFVANSEGSIFNNSGLKIWAPNVRSDGVNERFRDATSVYPFRLSVVRRANELSSARVQSAEDGSMTVDFTLKPGVKNPANTMQMSFQDVYPKRYQETTDLRFAARYADFDQVHIYQNYIETVLGLIHAAEKAQVGVGSDFNTTKPDADQKWLANLFTAVHSSGVPYRAVQVDSSSQGAILLTQSTTLWAKGGSDGTMNETAFNGLVGEAVAEYANDNSPLLDSAWNVESITYDSGFSLLAKYELIKFVAIRKDLGVVLTPYEVGGPIMSPAEEHSAATALRNRLAMYPESDYFGTAPCRGIIVGRSGMLRNSLYTKRLPLTVELADKCAKFMGASNGQWKRVALFDKAPNNWIEMFDDVSSPYIPKNQRNKEWDVGLNSPQRFDRRKLYFPALKTVYDNDTSVLTSFITVMCAIELQKVGERIHRRYSGVMSLTDAQLVEALNREVEKLTVGRFAGLFKIAGAAVITEADRLRGFSWTLPIKLFANNMKTVETLYIESWRMEDATEDSFVA